MKLLLDLWRIMCYYCFFRCLETLDRDSGYTTFIIIMIWNFHYLKAIESLCYTPSLARNVIQLSCSLYPTWPTNYTLRSFCTHSSLLPVTWNQVFSYAYNTLRPTPTFFQLLPVLLFLIYTSVWFIVGNNDKARNVSTISSWFSRPLLLQHLHYRSLTFVPAPCKWRWYGKMTRQWLMVVPVPQVVYWFYCWELTWFLSTS